MNPTMVQRFGPWTVTAEQEYIDVLDDSPKPDKVWRFIDAAGHGHFWKDGYPTLELTMVPCYCGDDDDEHTVDEYVCPHCREVIRPGLIHPLRGAMRPMKGRLNVTLTFEDDRSKREYLLSEEDGRAVLNDPVEAIPRVTADATPSSAEYRR